MDPDHLVEAFGRDPTLWSTVAICVLKEVAQDLARPQLIAD
jgi:hypothetical protein